MLKARRSARILLSLAAMAAVLAVVLFLNHVNAVERQFGEFEEVLVASQDIAARVPITSQAIATVRIPKRYLRPGLLTNKEEVINHISLVPLAKGEFIQRSILRAEPFPEGTRALTMTASQVVIIDDDLHPGDRVDVMAAFKEAGTDVSRIVLKDLEILTLSTDGRQRQLSVLVRADEAERLIWVENFGKQVRFLRSRFGQ